MEEPMHFKQLRELGQVAPHLQKAVGDFRHGVAVAALERIVQLCTADTKGRIGDGERISAIEPVLAAMRTFRDSLVAQAVCACALASLTVSKKPYPRGLQGAAADGDGISLVMRAVEILGPLACAQPAKEALCNLARNNPDNLNKAVKAGASWLPALLNEPRVLRQDSSTGSAVG